MMVPLFTSVLKLIFPFKKSTLSCNDLSPKLFCFLKLLSKSKPFPLSWMVTTTLFPSFLATILAAVALECLIILLIHS